MSRKYLAQNTLKIDSWNQIFLLKTILTFYWAYHDVVTNVQGFL